MIYRSTKTFTPEQGLSCVFRQWRAKSHCRFLHGYAIWVKFTFEARNRDGVALLDENGWVLDFGGLKPLRDKLIELFDHRLLVASDDPMLPNLRKLEYGDGDDGSLVQLTILPRVGCEAFAKHCFDLARDFLRITQMNDRIFVCSCEVGEHGANSAIFTLLGD
jgi:6-pyruvoyltetrahydropterin/6-carboxytetrahydropterin synthase